MSETLYDVDLASLPTIDGLATERHFYEHTLPVWSILPGTMKGVLLRNFEPNILSRFDTPVLVRSIGDARKARLCGRPVIYMEHGCGISYHGDPKAAKSRSYAGGPGKDHAVLILTPGPYATEKQKEAYPDIPVREVGCPKLDFYIGTEYRRSDPPVVAISFHWNCNVCPETRSAWKEYQSAVIALSQEENIQLLGHGHPRILDTLSEFYEEHDIPWTPSFHEVMEKADCYVVDNSSTLYEFAATDRPVVLLNASFYRRDVHHGLRFWEQTKVGVNCNTPKDLIPSVYEALEDSEDRKRDRREAVRSVYGYLDGFSTERAGRAIVDILAE